MSEGLYNHFRKIFKDAYSLSLRIHNSSSRPASKSRARSMLTGEPISEMNKFGYNPALERRLMFKIYPAYKDCHLWPNSCKYFNIHYLMKDEYLETLYRSEVSRIETKEKLAV